MRPESLFFLFSPVTRIKGVGPAIGKALANLLPPATAISGSSTPIIRDLLFHLPVSIVDRRITFPLNQAPADTVATFVITVDEHVPPKQKRYGKQPYRVMCSNDTGDITLVFFNARESYLTGALPVGQQRVISGRTEHFDFGLQMTHPDIIAPISKLEEVQKPEPVYPLTMGITSRRVASMVADALAKLPILPEWIGEKTLAKNDWPRFKEALTQAHHPQAEDEIFPLHPARMRLAYDEMLANQLHLAILRRNMQQHAGEVIKGSGVLTNALTSSLPFTLTKGQMQADKEIATDLGSGRRMARLLQGDVGSGKTIVALLSMLRAAEQGVQSALMVPTELIAQQHYETIRKLLSPLDNVPEVVLLTGSIKGAARKEVLEKIANGSAKIIVGTHALFQEKVQFHKLALAVVDEQHRFGVGQRQKLLSKGDAPHILHMTATPIPRSLTMTLYGDMDVSLLKEKPAERQPITTRLIPDLRYDEVVDRLQAAMEKGEKAYWICPLIEEKTVYGELDLTPEQDIAAAETRFAEFNARFKGKVGLVHGRMKKDERDEQMRRFAEGEVRLLVATTVVEVGVDVRDATIMVIEKAERFGLSQLHQLRGRVGRGDKASACVLLYSEMIKRNTDKQMREQEDFFSPSAIQRRLAVLRETEDGFKIAEEDLAIRGGGDLLGTRQSGLPRFIFTDLFEHQALLSEARDEAETILKENPKLDREDENAYGILLQLFAREP